MKAKLAKIQGMIAEMEAFIQEAKEQEQAFEHLFANIHPNYQHSARNLFIMAVCANEISDPSKKS
ncbi:MAG: hypothetical protein AAF399_27200 [Bacteroidota bacterium]